MRRRRQNRLILQAEAWNEEKGLLTVKLISINYNRIKIFNKNPTFAYSFVFENNYVNFIC